MDVILLQDVKGLGRRGEIVKVSEGYARNLLIPKKLGSFADSKTRALIQESAKRKKKSQRKKAEIAEALVKEMSQASLEFTRSANDEGVLYASLKKNEIQDRLKERFPEYSDGFLVFLSSAIKSVGDHEVKIQLHSGVKTSIKVIIKATNGKK